MSTISVEEAQAKLPKLIHQLAPGDAVTITENDRPVARLIPIPSVRAAHASTTSASDGRAEGGNV